MMERKTTGTLCSFEADVWFVYEKGPGKPGFPRSLLFPSRLAHSDRVFLAVNTSMNRESSQISSFVSNEKTDHSVQ